MAEIKLNDDFMTELAEFKASADELNEQDYYKFHIGNESPRSGCRFIDSSVLWRKMPQT